MAEQRASISWEFKGNKKRANKVDYRLFGRKLKRNGKWYYYNGILRGWVEGKPVIFIDHQPLGRAHISVPALEAEKIVQLISQAKADVVSIEYNTRTNLYIRRFSQEQEQT